MPAVNIGSLPLYTNNTDGVSLLMRNPSNQETYRVTKEQLLSGVVGSGVTSFNTRTGIVSLLASDISGLGIGIISSSAFSSPSQGTLRATVNGVQTDVDLGLQTGDSVSFNTVTATLNGNASTATTATTASHALTASSADSFVVRSGLTGSNALFTSNITAQTLVVQTVTSSIVYSSGSNRFGNQLTDVQQMTGSLRVTGSGDHWVIGGNVGIGATSPSQKLHIYNGNLLVNNNASGDTNSGIRIVAPISTTHVNWMLAAQQNVSNTFEITPSTTVGGTTFSTPTAVFTNDGKVGIGTTSPGATLDVNGNLYSRNSLSVGKDGAGSEYFLDIGAGRSGNGYAYIDLIGDATYTDYGLRIIRGNGGANTTSDLVHRGTGDFKFSATEAAAFRFTNAGGERLTILAAGNVGIGTTSPGQKLQVDSGSLLVNTGTGASSFRDIMIGGLTGWSTGESHGIDTVYNTAASPTTFTRIESYFDGTSAHMYFRNFFNASSPQSNVLMTIRGSGNVGIGTTNPGAKLQVSGSLTDILLNVSNPSGNGIYISSSTLSPPLVGIGTTDLTPPTATTLGTKPAKLTIKDDRGNAYPVLSLVSSNNNYTLIQGVSHEDNAIIEMFATQSSVQYYSFVYSGSYSLWQTEYSSDLLQHRHPNGQSNMWNNNVKQNNIYSYYNGGSNEANCELTLDVRGWPWVYVNSNIFAKLTSSGSSRISDAGTYHEINSVTINSPVLRVRNQAASQPIGIWTQFSGASPDNNTEYFFRGSDSTTDRIYIYSDGDLANHDGVYGTISDIKFKQDIVDATSQWEDIKNIRFRKFRMKEDVEKDPNAPYLLGVVAQELELTSPGLVESHPDFEEVEVPALSENGEQMKNKEGTLLTEIKQQPTGTETKTVKSSILLMKAAKALQEAIERIEVLEAKVTELESKL